MYAVVDIAGDHLRVEKGVKILVPKLHAVTGEKVSIDRVLLISEDDKVLIGQPTVSGASVAAQVLGHTRGKKALVYKKKRRKNYRRKRGHREDLTELLIEEINLSE